MNKTFKSIFKNQIALCMTIAINNLYLTLPAAATTIIRIIEKKIIIKAKQKFKKINKNEREKNELTLFYTSE